MLRVGSLHFEGSRGARAMAAEPRWCPRAVRFDDTTRRLYVVSNEATDVLISVLEPLEGPDVPLGAHRLVAEYLALYSLRMRESGLLNCVRDAAITFVPFADAQAQAQGAQAAQGGAGGATAGGGGTAASAGSIGTVQGGNGKAPGLNGFVRCILGLKFISVVGFEIPFI